MENLGIPYMWSKRSLAKYIVQYIKNENPKAKYFYDIFWGGGAVSFEALKQSFEKVYYLDLDKGMCNLMEQIKNGIPKEWNKRVSREDFSSLKDKEDAYSVAMSICWSFGNERWSYAYSEALEPRKKALHFAVVYEDYSLLENLWIYWRLEWKTIEARRLELKKKIWMETLKHLLERYSETWIYSLQTLQSLENIQRLEHIERLEKIEILNSSYDKIKIETPIEETVLYLDPPYRWTWTYKVQKNSFDYKKLDKRFRELPCPAYMSEENPHKVAISMVKWRTMQWGNGAKVFEVLYTNNKHLQKPSEEMLF